MKIEPGEMAGGRVARSGAGRFDALLLSRLDVDLRVLDLPPIAGRDIEGLIRFKLRSLFPGSPRETSFDYRVTRRGRTRRAIVFVARTSTVEAYRAVAGRRPLVPPCRLLSGRVPRHGTFRAWVGDGRWAELLEYRDGLLESSRVVRRERGDWGPVAAAATAAPLLVIAPREDLEGLAGADGAALLPLESAGLRGVGPRGLFAAPARTPVVSPAARAAMLAAVVLGLGVLVLNRVARREEERAGRLLEVVSTLEREARTSLETRREAEALRIERDRLDAGIPPDRYRVLAELSAVFAGAVRVRRVSFRDDRFQVEASGGDPLALMEALKARDGFRELELSPVVPDAASREERFSIAGVFRGR
jgi:hypothetical protein